MDKDLRASLVVAISAAALSALVGVFAGVGFFTLLLRALLAAALIGAAAYGCIFLLRSLVPGVLSQSESNDGGSDALRGEGKDRGANVDIVLPGEDAVPESFTGGDEAWRLEQAERAAERAGDRAGAAFARDAVRAEADDEASDLSPVDETSLLDPDGREGSESDAAVAMPASAGGDKGRRPTAGFDDLDILPDLEGFSDSFTASEFASGGSSSASAGLSPSGAPSKSYGPSSSGSRAGQEGLDPASLAQAVRTILKRDQKG